MSNQRVVITGTGPVSALGLGHEELSDAMHKGESGIGDLTLFDAAPYERACAAEVRDFDVSDYVETQQSYLDRSAEIAFASMHLAVADAQLDISLLDRETTGLILGSAWGSQDTSALFFTDVQEKGPRYAKPFLFPHTYANTVISLLAMEYGLTGFHMHLASGSNASSQALVQAYDLVRTGRQKTVFAGGYESLSEVRMCSGAAMGQLSGGSVGDEICAPFDKNRNGTIMGEGGAILVVEELEHAKARGARIRGEIYGAGLAGNIAGAMRLVGAEESKPDCIIASANGTQDLDGMELSALTSFPDIYVTAPKSLTGETAGASGALHAVASLCMIESSFIPAISNLVAPQLDSPNFVIGETRECDVSRIIVNSADYEGNAVSLGIEKYIS